MGVHDGLAEAVQQTLARAPGPWVATTQKAGTDREQAGRAPSG